MSGGESLERDHGAVVLWLQKVAGNEYLRTTGLLLAVLVILLGRVILKGEIFLPADLLRNFFPWKAVFAGQPSPWNPLLGDRIDWTYPTLFQAREAVSQGQVPLWNPYPSGGLPTGTLPMYGLLFPLNLLFLVLPLEQGLGLHALLRLLVAGLGMYAFLREIGVRRWGARVGAIAFMLNGFHIVWLGVQTTYPSILIPLLLWTTERFIRRRDPVYVCVLALVVASMIAGGFIAVAAYGLYAWGLYVLWRLGELAWRERSWRPMLITGPWLAAGLLLGLLLIAMQLIPLTEFLELTSYDQERAGRGAWHLPLWQIVNYLIPDYYGNHVTYNWWGEGNYLETAGYVGVMTLLMAGLALMWRWRNRFVLYFGVLGWMSFALVYGLPLRDLVTWMPMIDSSSPTRFLIINGLVLAGLAGFGTDGLLTRTRLSDGRRTWITLGLVTLCLLSVLAGVEIYWGRRGIDDGVEHTLASIVARGAWNDYQVGNVLFFGFLLLGCLTLTGLVLRGWSRPERVAEGLVWLLAFDLLVFALPFNPTLPKEDVRPQTPAIQFLQADQERFRIMGVGFFTFYPNLPGVYGIEDIRGHNPLRTDRVKRFWQAIDPRAIDPPHHSTFTLFRAGSVDWESPVIDLMNVKYVVFDPGKGPPENAPSKRFQMVYDGEDLRIYENRSRLPRAWWVPRAEVVEDAEVLLQLLVSRHLDPREVVLLEKPIASSSGLGQRETTGKGQVAILEWSANRLVLEVSAPSDGFVVLSELFYPGWQARVDGEVAEVLRANYALRAVAVPAGTQQLKLYFWPRSWRLGLMCSAVAVVALVGVFVWRLACWNEGHGHE